MKRPFRTILNLTRLEDRTVPATATYSAGTLTITAATGDIIRIDPVLTTSIPGYDRVTVGPTVIFDSGNSQPVRNLVVRGNAAENYTFLFGLGISLNNVSMTGAAGPATAFVFSLVVLGTDTRISGNFTFTGNAARGDDAIFLAGLAGFGGTATIGGNVSVNFQAGNDLLDIAGGSIGGNLSVIGGAGNDTFNVVSDSSLSVGGNVNVNLGNGDNRVGGVAAHSFSIGRNFNLAMGTGDDRVDYRLSPLRVGGSISANLGPSPNVVFLGAETWQSGDLFVGGNFTGLGGVDYELLGPNFIGGNVSINEGPGINAFQIGQSNIPLANTAASFVGGNITYTGGTGDDVVSLDHLRVGRNVNLNLGAKNFAQNVAIGQTQIDPVQIAGSLTIRGDVATTNITRTRVGGTFGLFTAASADVVFIDDSDLEGAATIDLGGGPDTLSIDTQVNDGFLGVPLARPVRFQSSLTVYGRDGADIVNLGFGGTGVDFGAPVRLFGGSDNDTLFLNAFNVYLQARQEDFELGVNFPP